MRQLRPTARSDRPDQSALADGPPTARVPENETPVPRSARVRGSARRLDREADALAAKRAQLLAPVREGAEAAADHARSRLGRADPDSGLRGARRQEDLRLV